MRYEVIGKPQIQKAYCDEYETCMTIELRREDGVTGTVWVLGMGDSPDGWCPEQFGYLAPAGLEDGYQTMANDVLAACRKNDTVTR